MPAAEVPSWFRILSAARVLCPDGKRRFMAVDLAEQAEIEDAAHSKREQIASAWLGKFVRWGYCAAVGQQEGYGPRPKNFYVVTQKGLDCELQENQKTRFERLLEAVRAFQRARGTKAEGAAFAQLARTADAVAPK